MAAEPGDRRQRVRAATLEDIKATARQLLIDEGPTGVTLRAIARKMGMTAPAIYRYFDSLEALLGALCEDAYTDLLLVLEQEGRQVPQGHPGMALVVASRAFRGWAVANPRIFGLIFGSPLPGVAEWNASKDVCGLRFAMHFAQLFVQFWTAQPFPVAADDQLPPSLVRQLSAYRSALAQDLPEASHVPIGAIHTFLQLWVQLYGAVTLEIFGHLAFCMDDLDPYFEMQLVALGASLGLTE